MPMTGTRACCRPCCAIAASRAQTVFTIHNLAFQGNFSLASFGGLGLPAEIALVRRIEFYDRGLVHEAGLRYSDRLTTVARAMPRNPHRRAWLRLRGAAALPGAGPGRILNGIRPRGVGPGERRRSAGPLQRRRAGRQGRPARPRSAPRWGWPTAGRRWLILRQPPDPPEMADVVLEALRGLVANGGQVAIHARAIATSSKASRLARGPSAQRRGTARLYQPMAHRMHCGADLSLNPSRFEPCGLTTMYAMPPYGALPVTRPVWRSEGHGRGRREPRRQ